MVNVNNEVSVSKAKMGNSPLPAHMKTLIKEAASVLTNRKGVAGF